MESIVTININASIMLIINGKCNCAKEKIKEILDNLTKANMFFKKDGDLYTLQ